MEHGEPNRCRLCQAFLKNDFPAPGDEDLERRNHFSRHRAICDACLACDFSILPPMRMWNIHLLGLYAISLCVWSTIGPVAAALATAYVRRHQHIMPWWLSARPWGSIILFVGIWILSGPLVGLIVWPVMRLHLRLRTRRECVPLSIRDEERRLDAERFYYLALWAALTGRRSFRRRMLRRAKRSGFRDPARLEDPALHPHDV